MLAPLPGGLTWRVLAPAAVVVAAGGFLVVRAVLPVGQADVGREAQARPQRLVAAAVQTAPTALGFIRSVLTYAGTVQASQQVNVVPRASGVLQEIPVEVGTLVRQGDTLAVLDPGTVPDQLADATAGIAVAQAKLGAVLAGAKPDDVAIGQAQLDVAQARLDAMLAGSRQDVPTARASLESALAKLEQLVGPKPEHVAAAEASLHSAQAKLEQLRRGARPEEVAAARANLEAARAKRNEVLAGPTSVQLTKAQAEVEAAQDKLIAAQQKLREGSGSAGAIATARADLVVAEAKLREVQQGSTEAEKLDAEADVAQAEAKLAALQPTQADIAAAEAAVAQAQKTLADLVPTRAEIAAASVQVAQALDSLAQADREVFIQEQLVKQAEANLNLKANPYLPSDVAAAQAAVAQARAKAAVAQANLDQTVVRAPFDGVVGQKLLPVGAVASPQSPILTLISREVEVDVTVGEASVRLVRPGQAVELLASAYPGVPITGTVFTLAPLGDARTHTFAATIRPDPEDDRLLPGMFIQARIIVEERHQTLLVPRQALLRLEGGATVFVARDGRAIARPVEVGFEDEQSAEIIHGLAEGDQVVVVGQATLQDGQPVRVLGPQPGSERQRAR